MADKTEADPPLRILFVENSAADVEVAESVLLREGMAFSSTRVETRDALLQALNEFRPEVVISDYALPEFDGLQALALTLAHDPALPFILFAGAVGEETAVACMKAGATDYIPKARMLRLPFAVKDALAKRGERVAREQAEDALLDSRNRFQALVETTSDFIWEMDLRGVYTYCSPQLETLWGLNPKEMIGKTPFDLLPPEDAQQAIAGFRALLASASPFKDLQARSFDGAGQIRFLEINGVPFFDTEGRLSGYRGTTRDITERKRAEEALARDRNLLRTLMESLPDKVYIKDAESRYVLNNLAHLRSLGVTRQEDVLGKTSFDFFPQPLAARYRADEQEVMRSGQPLVEREEAVVDLATGQPAWHLTTKAPLWDSQGKVVGLVGVSRDITERKRAEEGIQSLARFPSENPNPILRIARDGTLLYINQAGLSLLPEWHPRVGQAAPPMLREAALQSMNNETTQTLGLKYGEQVYSFSVAPLVDAGYANLYGQDVTERKQAEEALQHSEMQYRTLSGNSPDLIARFDRQCRHLYVNSAAAKAGLLAPEEYIGKTICQVGVVEPEASKWEARIQDVFETGKIVDVEDHFDTPAGRHYFHTKFVPEAAPDGSILSVQSIARDITDRKRAEESLRASEEDLREAQRVGHLGSWNLNVVTGGLQWSDECYCIYGFTPQEFTPTYEKFRSIVHPEDLGFVQEQVDAALNGDKRYDVDFRFVRPNGEIGSIHCEGEVARDAEGKPLRFFGTQIDITERKRAEDAARDQRQLAEALCETAAALNHSLDLDHLLDTILENAGRVLPHDAGEVLLITPGRRVRDVRHRGYAERGLEEWAKGRDFPLSDFPVLAHIAETRQPLVISDKHGFPGWANVPEASWFRSHVCAPVIGKDQVTGFISLSSIRPDIYGLEHARRLGAFADQVAVALENAGLLAQVRAGREQLRALSRRLLEAQEVERRRVARELHDEVGQLLTGLKLVLQMAAAGALQGQMPGLDEAEGLVGELMGRVRQLSLDLRPAMLDDLGLLPALLWHQQRYTQQTHVAVDFKHAGIEGRRFSPEIETAAYRIVQEALTNVARHSGVNQATVRVWADSEALSVQVEDQGAGFDAEGLSASGKTIGLAGMRERVALLDGQLTLETAPGQGAHLTAALPLAEPARKRAAGR
jgi:PAS domain S-box-containing protein